MRLGGWVYGTGFLPGVEYLIGFVLLSNACGRAFVPLGTWCMLLHRVLGLRCKVLHVFAIVPCEPVFRGMKVIFMYIPKYHVICTKERCVCRLCRLERFRIVLTAHVSTCKVSAVGSATPQSGQEDHDCIFYICWKSRVIVERPHPCFLSGLWVCYIAFERETLLIVSLRCAIFEELSAVSRRFAYCKSCGTYVCCFAREVPLTCPLRKQVGRIGLAVLTACIR